MVRERQSRFLRFSLDGEDVAIQTFERFSTSDIVPDAYLWVGNKKINLDDENMNPKLARLLPRCGWLTPNCKPEHWRSFIQMAKALDKL
jgi:hypothetical protein